MQPAVARTMVASAEIVLIRRFIAVRLAVADGPRVIAPRDTLLLRVSMLAIEGQFTALTSTAIVRLFCDASEKFIHGDHCGFTISIGDHLGYFTRKNRELGCPAGNVTL